MDKKIPKEKLFGRLAKEITPKALNTYREDMQNFKNFYRDKPQKEKPKDLYKDVLKFDYEGLTKDMRIFLKIFLKSDEPLIKPDLEKKKDPDLQNGLGSLINVKD